MPGAVSQAMEALKLQGGYGATPVAGGQPAGAFGASSRRRPHRAIYRSRSKINHRVTGQRRFATQHYQLDRIKELAHISGGSLNDIGLYLCGTALRRFLVEQDELPDIR